MGYKSIGNSSSFPCKQIPELHPTVTWDAADVSCRREGEGSQLEVSGSVCYKIT